MFECYYYENERGDKPVKEFLLSLGVKTRAKFVDLYLRLLEEYGPALRLPHGKKLQDSEGIYEVRFHGNEGSIRVLYFFDGRAVVLTNGFIKKSNKTPVNEIRVAEQRQKLYFVRRKEGLIFEKV